jgi:hypothetical protein
MPFQLTRAGIVRPAAREALAACRRQFDLQHFILIPRFFDAGLLALAQRHLAGAAFQRRSHRSGNVDAEDLCMERNALGGVLHFLANDPRLLRLVEEATGCRPLGSFSGFVYRLTPGPETFDDWHDDLHKTRRVALSVNLSTRPYQGGVLEIRERASGRVVSAVHNTGPGDALLFRIAPALQHRVSALAGDAARTVFAGWFREQPAYRCYVKEMLLAQ